MTANISSEHPEYQEATHIISRVLFTTGSFRRFFCGTMHHMKQTSLHLPQCLDRNNMNDLVLFFQAKQLSYMVIPPKLWCLPPACNMDCPIHAPIEPSYRGENNKYLKPPPSHNYPLPLFFFKKNNRYCRTCIIFI